MTKTKLFTYLAGILFAFSSVTSFADSNEGKMVKVWSVDYSGRPPFKRELIEVPAVDLARLEAANEIVEVKRVWTVDYSGKPPFRRRVEEVAVIDIASLETLENDKLERKKPLGSFKRHR